MERADTPMGGDDGLMERDDEPLEREKAESW